jgi:hypothetical protein
MTQRRPEDFLQRDIPPLKTAIAQVLADLT